jgi:hypothetical protein
VLIGDPPHKALDAIALIPLPVSKRDRVNPAPVSVQRGLRHGSLRYPVKDAVNRSAAHLTGAIACE